MWFSSLLNFFSSQFKFITWVDGFYRIPNHRWDKHFVKVSKCSHEFISVNTMLPASHVLHILLLNISCVPPISFRWWCPVVIFLPDIMGWWPYITGMPVMLDRGNIAHIWSLISTNSCIALCTGVSIFCWNWTFNCGVPSWGISFAWPPFKCTRPPEPTFMRCFVFSPTTESKARPQTQ